MRLDEFIKTVDSSTQLLVDLITVEPEGANITASGLKKEIIPTLISKDISGFDTFDIYLVEIIWKQSSEETENYPLIYVLAKENPIWT